MRTNSYSVPVRLIGRTVRVLLHANDLVVYDRDQEVARRERLSTKCDTRLELDHYVEVLIRKPGALLGATALEQARAAGKFAPIHQDWWTAARAAHGDKEGSKALIEVLLLSRHVQHEHLVAGLAAALRAGPPRRSGSCPGGARCQRGIWHEHCRPGQPGRQCWPAAAGTDGGGRRGARGRWSGGRRSSAAGCARPGVVAVARGCGHTGRGGGGCVPGMASGCWMWVRGIRWSSLMWGMG
ncbi:hypothetical protein [Streptomyces sp. NPDC056468]|uniref:Mu transposase domain-containing protein n=1 Tax=Streptomyces sp. NPDC056468 TaxID=3345830 RepID=UPI00369900CE